MKRLQIGVVTFAIVLGMLTVSCDKESSGVTQYITVGKLGVNSQVSDCGGFAAENKMLSLNGIAISPMKVRRK